MAGYAGHEREGGGADFAREGQEGAALGAGEEEGLGVGAEDDEAGEAGGGEVGVVFCLGGEVEGVGEGVEEGYGGAPDAGWGRGDGRHVCLYIGGRHERWKGTEVEG